MEKTFVFDMDGLLIDSERLILSCILEAAPENCDRETLKSAMFETIGVTDAELKRILYERMGEGFSFDDCEKRAEEIYFAHLKEKGVPVKPGARELLGYLHERGYRLGLASSSPKALVEMELSMAGMLTYFSAVAAGDMVKAGKPAPDVYLLACELLCVEPARAYAVEDAPKGIQAAVAAGLRPFMVPDLAPATDALRAVCLGVFDTLTDLETWVKACESKES